MTIHQILLLCCSIFSAQCALIATSPQAPVSELPMAEQIQPRALGAKWRSDAYFVQGRLTAHMGVTTEEVIATKTIDGVTCYQIELVNDYRTADERAANQPMESGSVTYFWEYHNRNGSYDFSDYDTLDKSVSPESLDQFKLTLPYPVKPGFTYQSGESENWEILSLNTKVKTPMGVYECVVYQLTEMDAETPQDSSRYRFYMAPGVGLVAFEWDEYNGRFSTWLREILAEYDLNEPALTSEIVENASKSE